MNSISLPTNSCEYKAVHPTAKPWQLQDSSPSQALQLNPGSYTTGCSLLLAFPPSSKSQVWSVHSGSQMSKTVDGGWPLSFWVHVGSASLSLSLSNRFLRPLPSCSTQNLLQQELPVFEHSQKPTSQWWRSRHTTRRPIIYSSPISPFVVFMFIVIPTITIFQYLWSPCFGNLPSFNGVCIASFAPSDLQSNTSMNCLVWQTGLRLQFSSMRK